MARETAAQALRRRQKEREDLEERERASAAPAASGRAAYGDERLTGALRDVGDQAGAAARGAQDALTLGLGDRIYAGGETLLDVANGADIGDAWRSRMAAERARDVYDAQHFPVARGAGQAAGVGLGLLALGPVDAALSGGVRIAEATPMLGREAAVLGGVGAAAGVGNQALADLRQRRLGSAGDYGGAALGGTAAALAAARGAPGQAGALGGAVTSVAQDLLNGHPVSWDDAGRAALAGGYVGAPLGYLGRAYSDGLSRAAKGELGEMLGRVRTLANGEIPLPGGRRVEVNGGPAKTVLDQETKSGLMSEQKFGRSNRGLTPNQRAAYLEFGDRYRVDHFLPRDVGAGVGVPFALLGYGQARGRGGQ